MTLSFESWIALVAALALLAATPGPGWAAVISTALARGFAPAVAMAVGMSLGDVVFLLLAIFGLSVLAELMGSLFLIVKIAGGAYLIYLGIRMWMKAPNAPATPIAQGGYSGVFLAGFGITLGNPKVIGFYLGFFPAFMDVSALTRYDIVAVAVTTTFTIVGVLAIYAVAAAASRRVLNRDSVRQIMGRTVGTMLVGTGVVVATRG